MKKQVFTKAIHFTLILSVMGIYSCKKTTPPPPNNNTSTITYDGFTYHTVKIGNQTWTVENAQVTHYLNGHSIRNVIIKSDWGIYNSADSGAWCYYNNSSNADTQAMGKLYNWYAIADKRGFAPPGGWRVADTADFSILLQTVMPAGKSIVEAGGVLKDTTIGLSKSWNMPNRGATNAFGFTALPAGQRLPDGTFSDMGRFNFFWTSTESSNPPFRLLKFDETRLQEGSANKSYGFSVRFVKDN